MLGSSIEPAWFDSRSAAADSGPPLATPVAPPRKTKAAPSSTSPWSYPRGTDDQVVVAVAVHVAGRHGSGSELRVRLTRREEGGGRRRRRRGREARQDREESDPHWSPLSEGRVLAREAVCIPGAMRMRRSASLGPSDAERRSSASRDL